MRNHVVLSVLLAGCLLAPTAVAQTTATISGTVRDQGGGVIPNAAIVITNVETQQGRALKTDESGLYSVPALPSGKYKVMVNATGFGTVIESDVVLTVG